MRQASIILILLCLSSSWLAVMEASRLAPLSLTRRSHHLLNPMARTRYLPSRPSGVRHVSRTRPNWTRCVAVA